MGVPAHDARDSVLAELLKLPVVNVIGKRGDGGGDADADADADADGVMVNSGVFDGMRPEEARRAIGEQLKVGGRWWWWWW